MAFADPQTIKVGNNLDVTLPRTGLTLNEGQFTSENRNYVLQIRHVTSAKRIRHIAQIRAADIVADPLVPAVMLPVGWSATITVDGPRQGVTSAQLKALAKTLVAWTTDAKIASLVGGES